MPFKSEAQRKYLYAKKPAVAKKFAKHGSKAAKKGKGKGKGGKGSKGY